MLIASRVPSNQGQIFPSLCPHEHAAKDPVHQNVMLAVRSVVKLPSSRLRHPIPANPVVLTPIVPLHLAPLFLTHALITASLTSASLIRQTRISLQPSGHSYYGTGVLDISGLIISNVCSSAKIVNINMAVASLPTFQLFIPLRVPCAQHVLSPAPNFKVLA